MAQDILNAKEKKGIIEIIERQWGIPKDLLKPYVFLQSVKDKIYLSSRALELVDLSKLRIDSMGMYFGQIMPDGFRVSIEGSQLIGSHCTRNTLTLGKEVIGRWMQGQDLEFEEPPLPEDAYVIVRYEETGDYVGCGKLKDKALLNYVPKIRRVKTLA